MRLPVRTLATVPLALAVALNLPTVSGTSIHPARHETDAGPDSSSHVFPILKWLRDTAVEVVFGKPSTRAKSLRPGAQIHTRYRNDVVVRFNVTSSEEEGALAKATEQMFLDIWAFTPDYVDIRLDKDDVSALRTLLPDSLQPSVLIPDVAAAVWATYPSTVVEKSRLESSMVDAAKLGILDEGLGNIFFTDYQTLPVITSWMRLIEAMFPSMAKMTSIGKSYEGRDIYAMRLGVRTGKEAKGPRKTILITGGLHGREWISTSSVTYLLWSVVTSYGNEQSITKLLEELDVVFIPVLNVDGYEYTWQTDRLWRKSRQQTKMRVCRGFDLDHAFGYEWDAVKHQSDPCSESYGGDEPFQAVEASALAKWAKNETEYGAKFVAFLDLHSYSQQVLFPYAYTCSVDPPNLENLEELAVGLAKTMRLSRGEPYTVTSACEGAMARSYSESNSVPRIETAGGSAIDWFYLTTSSQQGEETLSAFKYLADYLLGNNGIEKSVLQQQSGQWKDLKRRKR
ncbi:putative metallocarboxypeptidase ecm14 [Collariella sp. IMI 366227]|nr:putative metallocarboxypeptidase ecm14 [Collariella sp. IMI 366227]